MTEREPTASLPPKPPSHGSLGLPWLVALNVLLGASLWFGMCSDYAWGHEAGAVAHALLAVTLATWLRRRCPKGSIHRWLAWPSLLAAWPALAGIVFLALVLPFTLGGILWLEERSARSIVQDLPSPSGHRVAMVQLQPTGSYAGGTGVIRVQIRCVWLPGVRRMIWSGTTYQPGKPGQFVEWRDNKTLRLLEQKRELMPGWVEWRLPLVLEIPWSLLVHWTT